MSEHRLPRPSSGVSDNASNRQASSAVNKAESEIELGRVISSTPAGLAHAADLPLAAKKKTTKGAKSSRRKRKKVPTPEEIAVLKQQAAIMRKYLRAKRRRDEAFNRLAADLNKTWRDVLTRSYAPWDSQWRVWLAVYSPHELEQAIYIAGSKYKAGHFSQHQAVAIQELLPYVSGILKRRREQQARGLCPCCGNPV